MDTITRARKYSISAATTKTLEAASNVLDNNDPLPSMWVATGTAIAHAPNATELREVETGGPNIEFTGGRSVRTATYQSLRGRGRIQEEEEEEEEEKKKTAAGEEEEVNESSGSSHGHHRHHHHRQKQPSSHHAGAHHWGLHHHPPQAKAPWHIAAGHGVTAFGKFFMTPTGFFMTIYGLNIVAWGAMLFFLLLKAAPAMNHPDNGDADSSPRKIWIEIDSQILNALFCLTSWGLAPWRFRDAYWLTRWRFSRNAQARKSAIHRLAKRNDSWYRLRVRDYYDDDDNERAGDDENNDHYDDKVSTTTFTGARAPPTASWKMDFVVWMMVLNTLFQVGMAFFMWHWNRIDRPGWGTGTFIGLGCASSLAAGLVTWWEGRKVKKIEGPKVVLPDTEEEKENRKEEEEQEKKKEEEELSNSQSTSDGGEREREKIHPSAAAAEYLSQSVQ